MTRRAFTLLETMLVIGIVSLVIGLVVPAIQRVRASAETAQCGSNLRQIGFALHQFHQDHGRLPINIDRPPKGSEVDERILLEWTVHILPYIESGSLHQQALAAIRANPNPLADPPHTGYSTVIRLYVCPTDARLHRAAPDLRGVPTGLTSYIGNGGTAPGNGVLNQIPGVNFSAIRDGLSMTLMAGERPPPETLQSGRWYTSINDLRYTYPRDSEGTIFASPVVFQGAEECFQYPVEYSPGRTDRPCDRLHYWSMHPGGSNFLFCDNSVRFIPYRSKSILPALATREGNEYVFDFE